MLWSLRTTPRRTTRCTLFFKVYDTEAILPLTRTMGHQWVTMYKETVVKGYLEDALDQLNKARDVTLI